MGYFNFTSNLVDITRDSLQTEYLTYPIQLTDLRVWDAMATNLPGTAGSDDLALIGGTIGSASPMIKSSSVSGTTIAQKARFMAVIPAEYTSGGIVKMRIRAKVEVAAAVSATMDFSIYETDGTLSSDLVSNGPLSVNTTSFADYDFTLTSTSLVAGDTLDALMAFAGDDTGGSNACILNISQIKLYCQVRG